MRTTPARRKANKYSVRARRLLICEAVLSMLFVTGLYYFISRFYSQVFMHKAAVLSCLVLYTVVALASMLKLSVAILSFTLTATYMGPECRECITRCRLLYRLLFLREDRCSSDGWIVVTRGQGEKRVKLYMFKP